ncbi:extracellular calcium-sensing receptor-like [Hypanus sabinus]|uniref:extracellular calcium-sensing receptor-like n=1 Tax=Hypanus sabinus TaxID=79690 RepID=UPI0028C4F994|nr:extracellular calcium-sensing receptor-like [Hypanus sabinus]
MEEQMKDREGNRFLENSEWDVEKHLLVFFFLMNVPCGTVVSGDLGETLNQFQADGDYILGGLFPLYSANMNRAKRASSESHKCERIQLDGFLWAQAMIFAIEEINNSSTLLPNVMLGYDIRDTCLMPSVAMRSAISFLTVEGGTTFEISYFASSNLFNDKNNFPSFFRTIPTDEVQAAAVVSIVETFHWNWIAVIGTDNTYGRRAMQHFIKLVSKTEICIAFEELIPVHLRDLKLQKKMASIISYIVLSQANVTVVFAEDVYAEVLLTVALEQNMTEKVWIASESWVTSEAVASIPNISSIGTILGASIKNVKIPGFECYVSTALALNHMPKLKSESCNRNERHPEMKNEEASVVIGEDLERISFSVYSAAYTVAHALHSLLRCDRGPCNKGNIYPWQLLIAVREVNFTLHNQAIFFDEEGNPPTGYDIINWQWKGGNLIPEFRVIGEYRAQDKELIINASLIDWNTLQNKIPDSNCSTSCESGQVKIVKGHLSCCYQCVDCPAGTFLSDDEQCIPCQKDEWSPPRSVKCEKKVIEFFRWTDTLAGLLATLAAVGLSIIMAVIIIFIPNLNSPLVQLAGGTTCLAMLIFTATTCCSIYFFLGRPNWFLCRVRQPLFSIGFAGCLSAMLVKSFQVSGLPRVTRCIPQCFPAFLWHNGKWLIISFFLLIQCALCATWQSRSPPFVFANYNISVTEIFMECNEGSLTGFGLLLIYNNLLALACFLCTFMGRSTDKTYNLGRHITFAMLIYLTVWVFFIPAYTTTKGKFVSFLEPFAGLVSVYGIIIVYFLPKCYIILFKPEYNTQSYCQEPTDNPPSNMEGQ